MTPLFGNGFWIDYGFDAYGLGIDIGLSYAGLLGREGQVDYTTT